MPLFVFISLIIVELSWGKLFNVDDQKTLGQPVPEPQLYISQNVQLLVAAQSFEFRLTGQSCDIIDEALKRYYYLTFPGEIHRSNGNNKRVFAKIGVTSSTLRVLEVDIQTACNSFTYPSQDMDESYTLRVPGDSESARLSAKEVWGALRGLETFSQLVHSNPDFGYYQINETYVVDFPRFSIRGFLIDTSRHYLSVRTILTFIEALAQNKFNMLHWHIVDDQSFPYQSVTYPNLSIFGAFNPNTHVYTQSDVRRVIEFARLRGVRVLTEWDTPGHSLSWGVYYRELLTACCDQKGKPDGSYGPMDPTLDSTYAFVFRLLDEIKRVFPEQYVHLGGDEVQFDCWKSNANVSAFMSKMGYGRDYAKLQAYYTGRVLDRVLSTLDLRPVVWQEVFQNDASLDPRAVVDVWTNTQERTWNQLLAQVTRAGNPAILSACWYLNYISYGPDDLKQYYKCDPQDFDGDAKQKAKVLGGEACMWGEYVDASNLIDRSFPRGSVVGERLWSNASLKDISHLEPRLEEHRCRMLWRGLRVEPPAGPGFCAHEWDEERVAGATGASRAALWSAVYGFEHHLSGAPEPGASSASEAQLSLRPALTKQMRERVRRLRAEMRPHPSALASTHERGSDAANGQLVWAPTGRLDSGRVLRNLL